MKRLFLENWRAKVMSLIVATAVWYLVKKNIDVSPERPGARQKSEVSSKQ